MKMGSQGKFGIGGQVWKAVCLHTLILLSKATVSCFYHTQMIGEKEDELPFTTEKQIKDCLSRAKQPRKTDKGPKSQKGCKKWGSREKPGDPSGCSAGWPLSTQDTHVPKGS